MFRARLCESYNNQKGYHQMGKTQTKRLKRLQNSKSGHVAVILAITIFPIAVVAGFAVDFQMVTTKKTKAQYSLDAAVIAGSRKLQDSRATPQEIQLLVRQYFQAAVTSNQGVLVCEDPRVLIQGQDISAESICSQQTSLSAIAGVDEMKFKVYSASTFGIGKIDVAFVFDVSGSMIGTRMEQLKDAAIVAVDQLLPDDPPEGHEEDIRISMVSYNNSVNAGPYFTAMTGQSTQGFHRYYHNYYRRYFNIPYTTTCVFQRTGSEKFTDEPPGPNKYATAADYWDRDDCRDAPPVPLTTDRDTLADYVESLDPSGGTAGHLGIAWGWYMISPDWWETVGGSQPLNYDEPDTAKALILMTDGAFNATISNTQGSSTWQSKQLCDNIKDKGVVIYSVAFQAPQSGEDVLEYCSSGPEFFFNPRTGQQLTQSYQAIATSISDLRLTQ
jgi:Flp pilus assembly protein TadG